MRIFLLLLAVFGATCAAPPSETGVEPPRSLRVLTYNVHHGEGTDGVFDLERIASVIEATGADLAALQEVDVGTGRAAGEDQAARMPILGHVGESRPIAAGDRVTGDLALADLDCPLLARTQPGERLDQLGLPVALDSGHSGDLTRAQL